MLERWAAEALEGAGRLMEADRLHVTIAFLGRRPAGDLPGIVAAVRACAGDVPPFTLETAGYRETRSVGMIVLRDPSGAAVRLADDLQGRLERLGVYERERRRWLPHVTVLRFRTRPRLQPEPPPPTVIAPSGVGAYLSRLHPSGARYEVLEAVSLNAGG